MEGWMDGRTKNHSSERRSSGTEGAPQTANREGARLGVSARVSVSPRARVSFGVRDGTGRDGCACGRFADPRC